MPFSFDPRQLPGGPVYDEKGHRPFRGVKRYGDLGRVTPGDELENTRDHERLWMYIHQIREKARAAQFAADNIDLTSIQSQITDLDDIVTALPGVAVPDGAVFAQNADISNASGATDLGVAGPEILHYIQYANAGYVLQARAIGHGSEHTGVIGVALQQQDLGIGGTPLLSLYGGGNFDTGWIDVSIATSGIETDVIKAQSSLTFSYIYGQTFVVTATMYFRWTGEGVQTFIVGASDVSHGQRKMKTTGTLDGTSSFIVASAGVGSFTINLPAAASHFGRMYTIRKIDSTGNTVTVDANASETIDGDTVRVLSSQWETLQIISDGAKWHSVVSGNTTAAHLSDTSDAHDASAISVVSTTLVGVGTDVQAVFEELDDAIVAVAPLVTSGVTVSAANTDLSGPGGSTISLQTISTGGGTIRSIVAPTTSGSILTIRNGSASSVTLKHQLAGGGGARLWTSTQADVVLPAEGVAIFQYDGTNWIQTK